MDNNNKPFNKFYVLRITSLHIKKAIDTSIRKTYDRMKDVVNKSEVFETLDVLHKIRKLMEDFEANNKHLYKKPDENKVEASVPNHSTDEHDKTYENEIENKDK
tara:strand:- start:17753 stop:18064 length:312 start_codon:yes stop_codon:yes gene_type:complete